MCGVVGAVSTRDVTPILLEGLKRLEYRGYDSAGLALVPAAGILQRQRAVGKVANLEAALDARPLSGTLGIAHTRWATHGEPSELNAHPHFGGSSVAVVHNGIIENHAELKERLIAGGYRFGSDTDTEVIAHLIDYHLGQCGDLRQAVQRTVAELAGAYGLAVISRLEPGRLVAARSGSPLMIGLGIDEHFIASDTFALVPVTREFVALEEGDIADVTQTAYTLYDRAGNVVSRPVSRSGQSAAASEKGSYRHYMLKEIHEQPEVVAKTAAGGIANGRVLDEAFGANAAELFDKVENVQIVACGTSYHAGLIARYWLEELGVPCQVEVASEYRYRQVVVPANTLLVSISQSGETADTLAALRAAQGSGCLASLAVCNVAESSLVRESGLAYLTQAGREIGVASTKAFTTQLVALRLLTLALGRRHGLSAGAEAKHLAALQALPEQLEAAFALEPAIAEMAKRLVEKRHALFLGRGTQFPVALEGALKLKEISYIHAEAYPAGELKHGPLALVDKDMPVIAVLPNDALLEKTLSNLQEVRARGGEMLLFADTALAGRVEGTSEALLLPSTPAALAPIVYTVPLQLLAYHTAVQRGTDVDQPRNLAKSVTVE